MAFHLLIDLYAFLSSLYKGSHSSFSHLSCMSSLALGLEMKEELDVGAMCGTAFPV